MESTELNAFPGLLPVPIVPTCDGTQLQRCNLVQQRFVTQRIESLILVGNDHAQLELLDGYLRAQGFSRILMLDRPEQTIDKVRQHQPDLVFLTWEMNGMSGFKILQGIRNDPEISDSLVITLNEANAPETRAHAIEAGANDCLNQPVLFTELKFQTERTIEQRNTKRKLEKLPVQLALTIKSHTEELRNSKREAILCLARALEYREDRTGNHVIRIGRYAAIMATELGFPKPAVELIEQAAQLHDVGKIGVPDFILQKRGKLDTDEFARVVRHCLIGRQIICPPLDGLAVNHRSNLGIEECVFSVPSSPVLRMAATIVETHHEKWDGSGYPNSLQGDEIPLAGRIVAVADVFDALATERPYKAAYPIEKCLRILLDGRGKHFDPRVLDAFCARKDEVLDVQQQLGDSIQADRIQCSAVGITPVEAIRDGKS